MVDFVHLSTETVEAVAERGAGGLWKWAEFEFAERAGLEDLKEASGELISF
jgi:hypothetical protein